MKCHGVNGSKLAWTAFSRANIHQIVLVRAVIETSRGADGGLFVDAGAM